MTWKEVYGKDHHITINSTNNSYLVALGCCMCQMKEYPRIVLGMITRLECWHIGFSVEKNIFAFGTEQEFPAPEHEQYVAHANTQQGNCASVQHYPT